MTEINCSDNFHVNHLSRTCNCVVQALKQLLHPSISYTIVHLQWCRTSKLHLDRARNFMETQQYITRFVQLYRSLQWLNNSFDDIMTFPVISFFPARMFDNSIVNTGISFGHVSRTLRREQC